MSTHPNDLQRLAQKHGWKPGPLTYAQVQRMSTQQYEYNLVFNKSELEKALDSPRVEAENKSNAVTAKATRLWKDDSATPEEAADAMQATKDFIAMFPQFVVCDENAQILLGWCRERNLLWELPNIRAAYEAGVMEGRVFIDPTKLGIGTDTLVSGYKLTRHSELHRILAPAPTSAQKEKLAEQKMSANEYRQAHKEDWRENRISDRQRMSWNKDIGFFLQSRPDVVASPENLKKLGDFIFANGMTMSPQALHAAYTSLKAKGELELNKGAVQQGAVLSYVNLSGTGANVQSLQTALPEKESLAYKINKMDAKTYAEWISNPTNRRAIDGALAH